MIHKVNQARKSFRAMLDEKARAKQQARSNLPPFIRVGTIIVPRHSRPYGGVDHGAPGRCLLESWDADSNPVHQLVAFAGYRTAECGVRGFGRVYVPSRLALIDSHGLDAGAAIDISGGRMTPARVMTVADEIDRFFGTGAAALVETGSTIVVISPANAPRRR